MTAPAPGGGARARWPVFAAIVAAIVAVDQATKAWVLSEVVPGRPVPLLGDLVRLVYSENTGGLFGMFRDAAPVLAVLSLAVVAFILRQQARAGASGYVTLTLGLLLGGAIGNLIDRARLGFVVDFVDAGLGDLRFWTFNVADASISLAIVLLIGWAVRPSLAGEASRPAAAAADD